MEASVHNRKNILFIARWYPDRHDNMLGLFIQKHALSVQLFCDVTVLYVTADTTLAPGCVIVDEQIFKGIHEYRIYFGKHKNELFNGLAYAKYYLEGIKKINMKPDLVHVHVLSRTAFPALWLKMTKGIPYFITEHWSRYLPVNISKGVYSGWFRKLFTSIAVSQASGVSTVTNNLAQAMLQAGLKNTYSVIPNVADINEFRPVTAPAPKTVKKLVHVSCFDEPAKNIKGIISAVQKIAASRNDFILEIIGDGKDFELVKNHAKASGLLGSIIFLTGLLTGDELSEKMRQADAFVMFSNYENLPCTIVESLCSGVPVISTDVGGIREHVSDDFGILIHPGDENALAAAIQDVLDHPEKFDRLKMRSYSKEHFSMEAIGQLFRDWYKKAGMHQSV